MRKCTGTEGGLAGPGPVESPDPSSGKNASNCGLILLTLTGPVSQEHQDRLPGHFPMTYLMGLVVEKIKRLLGPSLSRMIAPFFRFAILLTLLWAGPALAPV